MEKKEKPKFVVLTASDFVQGAVKRFCGMHPDKKPQRYAEDEWAQYMKEKQELLALPKPYVKEDIDAITRGIYTELQCPSCEKVTSVLVDFGKFRRCPNCLNDALEASLEIERNEKTNA